MGKKIDKIILGTVLAAEIITHLTGCGQDSTIINKDDLNPPAQSESISQGKILNHLRINEINLKKDPTTNYAETYSCYSINQLTNSLIYELDELHQGSKKEVSPAITPSLLSSIFMCESSFKTSVDIDKHKNDEYAGIGQTNRLAIYDALSRINQICKSLDHKRLQEIKNNYFIQIFEKFVGDPTQEYTATQLNKASNDIFHTIELNQNKDGAKLGGAMSAMAICAIAGNNHSLYQNNPQLITMTYYCGSGNMRGNNEKIGFLNSGLIDNNSNSLIFNLDKLYSCGHSQEEIEKFQEGFIYMLKVMNIEQTITKYNNNGYKQAVQEIIDNIGNYNNGNWTYAIANLEGIVIEDNTPQQ